MLNYSNNAKEVGHMFKLWINGLFKKKKEGAIQPCRDSFQWCMCLAYSKLSSLSLNRAQCEEFTDYIMLIFKKTTLHRSYFLYPKNMNTYDFLELFDDK